MAAKTLKKSVLLTGSEVQTFLEEEENQYTKRKIESYVFSGFGVSISLVFNSTSHQFAALTHELCAFTNYGIPKGLPAGADQTFPT